MKEGIIGFVKEETFGEKPANSEPITLRSIKATSIIAKCEELLEISARFDCPYCGKGIQIKVDAKI